MLDYHIVPLSKNDAFDLALLVKQKNTTEYSIQPSAVRTQSNISRYYIRQCDDSGRTWIRIKITMDTPYFDVTGELWSIYCKEFGENWPHYNGTTRHIYCIYDNTIYNPYYPHTRGCFKQNCNIGNHSSKIMFPHWCARIISTKNDVDIISRLIYPLKYAHSFLRNWADRSHEFTNI